MSSPCKHLPVNIIFNTINSLKELLATVCRAGLLLCANNTKTSELSNALCKITIEISCILSDQEVSQSETSKKQRLLQLRKTGARIGLFLLNSIYLQGTYKPCFHKQKRMTSKRNCFRTDISKIVSASIPVQDSF